MNHYNKQKIKLFIFISKYWCETEIMGMIEVLRRLSSTELEEVIKKESFFLNLSDDWRDTDHCIDIDRTWDAIRYLLKEGASSFEERYLAYYVILGYASIENIDGGWGPASYLEPDLVVEVNEFLSNVTVDDIRERYNPESLDSANIYPGIWLRDKEEALEYILHSFIQVKKLYKDAAKAGECVLMLIF